MPLRRPPDPESDVHVAYQRMGAKLGNTVRKKGPVKGSGRILVRGNAYIMGDVAASNAVRRVVKCATG